jgi:hypothetical protein
MAGHADVIETGIRDLEARLAGMGRKFDEFYTILRNPGFTTPREAFLVAAVVQSAQNQAQAAEQQLDWLITGCKLIVEGREPDATAFLNIQQSGNNPRPAR